MTRPRMEISPSAIKENTQCIVKRLKSFNCQVVGVTKSCCGDPVVARSMLDGGVSMIGDSRLENINKMRQAGINTDFMLLRLPMLSEVESVVDTADVSLNSEIEVIRSLSSCAKAKGKVQRIILMVDLGDLREGVWPSDLIKTVQRVIDLPGIHLEGIGANFACYGGVIPTREKIDQLIGLKEQISAVCGYSAPVVSGGNSANLQMIWNGETPFGVNQLRIGEGILLGRETVQRKPLQGLRQDAFTLFAEIIEIKEKQSVPIGETGQDVMGKRPNFPDKGFRLRAILALGRQDVYTEGLAPCAANINIIGSSSDHLIVDVTDSDIRWRIGMEIPFSVDYAALMSAMASPYIEKVIKPPGEMDPRKRQGA
ncbi:MAG: alanine/ornithine racemase family PLP-dependent enzyme [Bacillota bacterium]